MVKSANSKSFQPRIEQKIKLTDLLVKQRGTVEVTLDKLSELLKLVSQRELRLCEQADSDLKLLSVRRIIRVRHQITSFQEAKLSLANADESLGGLQSQVDSLRPSDQERQIPITLLNKAWQIREDLEKLSNSLQSELNDERQIQETIQRLDGQLPLRELETMNKDQIKQVKKQQLPEIKVEDSHLQDACLFSRNCMMRFVKERTIKCI